MTLKECALTVLLLCNNDNNNNNKDNYFYQNDSVITDVNVTKIVHHNQKYYIEDKAYHTIIYTNAWKQGKDTHIMS